MDDEKTEERAFLLRGGAGLGKSVMAGVWRGHYVSSISLTLGLPHYFKLSWHCWFQVKWFH